ncbi:hypothetical protein BJ944DRAFT_259477 [Cunninghamella echinulata]|nr:hypothetical protein BJ944DRAFT_259477 [Cunninghamella echinulata]
MTSTIEPPFNYNPSCKPKKSILKQKIPTASNSWLSKFSSPDSTTSLNITTTTQTQQQKTFGLLRKFISNVNNSQATTAVFDPLSTNNSNNKSNNQVSQPTNIDNEELSSTELKRVRFSVNKLTVEYFPYVATDITSIEDNQITIPDIKADDNNNDSSSCKNDIKTTPRKVLAYYELACKNKEEPMIGPLVSTLMMHQQATYLTHIDLTNHALNNRILEPLADVLCLDFGLEKLTLKNCNLDDEGIKILLHSLLIVNTLQHLNLADNSNIRTNGFKYISIFVKNAVNLESLDLCGTLPDKKSMYYFSQALNSLDANNQLKTLLMDDCQLRPPQLEYLSNAIRKTKITYLSLRKNRFLNQSAISIGVMLRDYDSVMDYSHGLQQLILDYNEIRQDIQYIAQALRRNRNLKKLSMVDCKLDANGCVLISEALKYNQSLEILNLSSNPLCAQQNTEGINTLKQALYANQTLIELDLSNINISTEGIITLAECLAENKNLCKLDLSQNPDIDIAGLMALLSGMKLNSSLMFLDLNVPALDRDMVKIQNEIIALCTRNTQHNDQNLIRNPSINSNDSHSVITTTQATARLSLQERLAAVTKGTSSKPGSLKSVDSNDNLRSPPTPTQTPPQPPTRELRSSINSNNNRMTIQTNFESETSQVGLLEDMLHSEVQIIQTKNNINPTPNEVIMQVYFQCRKALSSLNNSIPHLMDSDQLCDLLALNDRLTSAIARYEEIYYSKKGNISQAPETVSSNHVEENNTEIETTTAALTEDSNNESILSFQIGEDEDADGDDILVSDDDNNDVDVSTNKNSVDKNTDNADTNADIHELRKKIEIEEGEAFKHSKDTDLSEI